MPHRERLGSHPWSRSHRPRIRGGQRDIKNEVWRYAPGSASLLGSTRTGAGEVEDGTLHSLLVKKLPDRQLENYSRGLNERARQNLVTALQKQRKWRRELAETCRARQTTESTELPGIEQDAKFSCCCNREGAKQYEASMFSLPEFRSRGVVL